MIIRLLRRCAESFSIAWYMLRHARELLKPTAGELQVTLLCDHHISTARWDDDLNACEVMLDGDGGQYRFQYNELVNFNVVALALDAPLVAHNLEQLLACGAPLVESQEYADCLFDEDTLYDIERIYGKEIAQKCLPCTR